ncbi:Putative uncharacterized protein [Moritella viscosa]|uniref:Uncharacterized protein n=1 Tax=Moritella viscosa TaxID=80854 RepID=A0A090IFF4_9GAMM|nr:hypothetical protein [Moritella viscosa]CED59567.1 putative uncharacterized protein [Moritella viscosa]SGY88500.1 Putative uncharacterized protein [Moritella viscosa]SGY88636.1 Putative uncharacterized protein [Moritella viscosa]SGY90661.1 Putative uncharacterized protein [Moritella viscosa]SHO01270.1 Putative uncharacterized protein [Moritella viscosa]
MTHSKNTSTTSTISNDDARKLSRKVTADVATKQLDEIFIDNNVSIDIQIAVTEYQGKEPVQYLEILAAHLRPAYLRIITESLQTQNLAALDPNSHYLKLSKTHKNMLETLKQHEKYKQLNDTQIIELALLALLRQ